MIKIICDKCGKDCGLNAVDISARVIHNPCPVSINDAGKLSITNDNSQIRFILCQECFVSLGLPNIYEAVRSGELKFRDKE